MNTLLDAAKAVLDSYNVWLIDSGSDADSQMGALRKAVTDAEGMVLVPIEQFASQMADLQPLGLSQNRGDRLWQLYQTPEECIEDIKKAMLAAAKVKP